MNVNVVRWWLLTSTDVKQCGPLVIGLYVGRGGVVRIGWESEQRGGKMYGVDQRFPTCAPRSPKGSACTSQGLRSRSKKIK
jgi:hypothetical protein